MFQPVKPRPKRARLSLPLCVFNRHDPYRQFVKWDGLNFVGECRHCGAQIRRKEHRVWHKDWIADSAADERAGPSRA